MDLGNTTLNFRVPLVKNVDSLQIFLSHHAIREVYCLCLLPSSLSTLSFDYTLLQNGFAILLYRRRLLYTPNWIQNLRAFVDLRQQDENIKDILSSNAPPAVTISKPSDGIWKFSFEDLTIHVSMIRGSHAWVVATSETMPRRYLDSIRKQLKKMPPHDYTCGSWNHAVVFLCMIEEAIYWIQTWKPASEEAATKGWDAKGMDGWKSILTNPIGIDLSSVKNTAVHLLGKSVEDICAEIPNWLRILHVEPVFRRDLVRNFLARKGEVYHDLLGLSYSQLRSCITPKQIPYGSFLDSRQGLARELSGSYVAFHGSPRHSVKFIVRFGFKIAGDIIDGKTLSVSSGVQFGRAIYSSPDPVYASRYSGYMGCNGGAKVDPSQIPGMRLIVCAVLMGRPLQTTREEAYGVTSVLHPASHSHVSPNKLEYAVFDTRQIIPCYVLHLDYGSERARAELERMPSDPRTIVSMQRRQERTQEAGRVLWPAEVKDKRQSLKAAAAKWFPYGYGPAQGTSFVIEEIGEVSDDEEIYGDYQDMRMNATAEAQELEERLSRGGSWFDEYQTVRRSNKRLDNR